MDFLKSLFAADFMPHGHCYFWDPTILGMHVGSDIITTLSYYAIPLALLYIIRRRGDMAFSWMFVLFGLFIYLGEKRGRGKGGDLCLLPAGRRGRAARPGKNTAHLLRTALTME